MIIILPAFAAGIFFLTQLYAAGFFAIPKPSPASGRFLFAQAGDEDMKVVAAGQKPSSDDKLEPSDEEIARYFEHKCCKNLDRARELGAALGQNILSFPTDFDTVSFSQYEIMLARMLYLFVTEDCARNSICDPILLKLVLAQINDTISQTLPDFYSRQYRSYTSYKICMEEERFSSDEDKAYRIGCCFAKLVGRADESDFCQTGKNLYLLMKNRCVRLLSEVSFVPID